MRPKRYANIEAEAFRQIAAMTWRNYWISAVLYLGIREDVAREVWQMAHEPADTPTPLPEEQR